MECTVKSLEYFLEQYNMNSMSYKDFKKHAAIKLSFLKSCIDFEELPYKEKAEQLIKECDEILRKESGYLYDKLQSGL